MKIAAFVPIKLNSERLPGKNIKAFDNGAPLISYILNTALAVKSIGELYVYCSCETIRQYLPQGVRYLKREERLDSSDTSITDVILAFVRDVDADIYVMLHATAPFLEPRSIETAVAAVARGGHDSALSVLKCQDFIWEDGGPMNYDVTNIPRTQDLTAFYIETTGMYVFTKGLAVTRRRVGENPFLAEVSKIEAIDINEPIDFTIANAIYNNIIKK
jgi:CMP-N-acetylneuraminic acid synthetase